MKCACLFEVPKAVTPVRPLQSSRTSCCVCWFETWTICMYQDEVVISVVPLFFWNIRLHRAALARLRIAVRYPLIGRLRDNVRLMQQEAGGGRGGGGVTNVTYMHDCLYVLGRSPSSDAKPSGVFDLRQCLPHQFDDDVARFLRG